MGVSPRKPHLLETHLVLITLIQYEVEKVREEDKKQTIRSYFIEGGDDNAFIARVMHTSIEYVQIIRNEMANTPLQV